MQMKMGMEGKEEDEALADRTGGAKDTCAELDIRDNYGHRSWE